MDDGSRISWLIVVLLLFGAMYFAMAETAFASVSRVALKTESDRGDTRAVKALRILDNFDRAITTILICTNIIHLAAAAIVTVQVTRIWGLSAVTLSTIITTIVVFFVGEMLPKSIARKYSLRLSLGTAHTIQFFMTVLWPFSWVLSQIGALALKMTKTYPDVAVTEDELYDIIEDMTEEGSLDEDQGELISSALQFGDVTVASILTSRVDLVALDITTPADEIMRIVKKENHSRLPVYEGSIDNIIGILQIRKFIKAYLRDEGHLDVRSLLDEPYFVYETTNVDDLLPILSRRKINLAVVLDNYGGTLGIVTVEDILEELVGEIWDEDDTAVEPIVALKDGTYSVDAEEHVIDVLDTLEIPYDDSDELDNKLMGELAYEQFNTIPREGDTFQFNGMEVRVSSMRHNRVLRLKVRALPRPAADAAEEVES